MKRKDDERVAPVIVVVNDWASVARAVHYQGATVLDVDTQNEAFRALKQADGLILTGGGDVAPHRYGESRHPKSYGIDKARDRLEFDLVRVARRRNIPIMGICRGHQLLNVAFGGSLHAHVPDVVDGDVHHGSGSHIVKLRPDSRIGRRIGQGMVWGTTLHHQAVRRVGKGLRPVGYAPDGIIEVIESRPGVHPYVLGTQFHPELDWQAYQQAEDIFAHFVEVCQRHRDSLNRKPDFERVADLLWTPKVSYVWSPDSNKAASSDEWTPTYGSAWEPLSADDVEFDRWLKDNADVVNSTAQVAVEQVDDEVDKMCIDAPCPTRWDCGQWKDCAALAVKQMKRRQ